MLDFNCGVLYYVAHIATINQYDAGYWQRKYSWNIVTTSHMLTRLKYMKVYVYYITIHIMNR